MVNSHCRVFATKPPNECQPWLISNSRCFNFRTSDGLKAYRSQTGIRQFSYGSELQWLASGPAILSLMSHCQIMKPEATQTVGLTGWAQLQKERATPVVPDVHKHYYDKLSHDAVINQQANKLSMPSHSATSSGRVVRRTNSGSHREM